jgi:hypothetical protein
MGDPSAIRTDGRKSLHFQRLREVVSSRFLIESTLKNFGTKAAWPLQPWRFSRERALKKYVLLLIVTLHALLWSGQTSAATCASSSLADYVALGSSGCTIGALSFSGFALRPPEANAVASTAITVTPLVVSGTVVGVQFGVSPTSSGGNFFDDLITYRVTGIAATLNAATVDFTGSSATGDAAVSVLEQLCLGGTFDGADGVSNCSSANSLNLAVVDIGFGPDPAYSLSFGPAGFLSVANDMAYDSGSGSVADSGSTLTSGINLFGFVAARAVPEPASVLLLAIGSLGLALTRSTNSRRRR